MFYLLLLLLDMTVYLIIALVIKDMKIAL